METWPCLTAEKKKQEKTLLHFKIHMTASNLQTLHKFQVPSYKGAIKKKKRVFSFPDSEVQKNKVKCG